MTEGETTASQNALDYAADLVRGRYRPIGHPHEIGDYISVSSLVKKSAFDYAREAIEWRAGRKDTVPPYYSFIGNTLADEAFADYDAQEVKLEFPIGNTGWMLRGHLDAITDRHGHVIVGEHKFHGESDAEDIEMAFRQGSLYLALAWAMAWNAFENDGKQHFIFEPASWAKINKQFRWARGSMPAGVVVAIAEPRPPGRVVPRALTDDQLEEILQFYLEKCEVIVDAIKTGDLTGAAEWDRKIGTEFAVGLVEINKPLPALGNLLPEFEKVRTDLAEIEARKDSLTAQIIKVMDDAGLTSASAEGVSVSIVENKGRETADTKALRDEGLDRFIRQGKPYAYIKTKRMV